MGLLQVPGGELLRFDVTDLGDGVDFSDEPVAINGSGTKFELCPGSQEACVHSSRRVGQKTKNAPSALENKSKITREILGKRRHRQPLT